MLYDAPALFTRMSKLGMEATQVAMEEEESTSRVRVVMPRDERWANFEGVRAVA